MKLVRIGDDAPARATFNGGLIYASPVFVDLAPEGLPV